MTMETYLSPLIGAIIKHAYNNSRGKMIIELSNERIFYLTGTTHPEEGADFYEYIMYKDAPEPYVDYAQQTKMITPDCLSDLRIEDIKTFPSYDTVEEYYEGQGFMIFYLSNGKSYLLSDGSICAISILELGKDDFRLTKWNDQ